MKNHANEKSVLVIPCSGIGKVHGLISREATYLVTDELAPGRTDTLCLGLLVKRDQEAVAAIKSQHCITIDGCPKACAKVNVEAAGGKPVAEYRVFDVYRAHKELKVRSVSDLGESGREMARILAEEIAAKVDELTEDEGRKTEK